MSNKKTTKTPVTSTVDPIIEELKNKIQSLESINQEQQQKINKLIKEADNFISLNSKASNKIFELELVSKSRFDEISVLKNNIFVLEANYNKIPKWIRNLWK